MKNRKGREGIESRVFREGKERKDGDWKGKGKNRRKAVYEDEKGEERKEGREGKQGGKEWKRTTI